MVDLRRRNFNFPKSEDLYILLIAFVAFTIPLPMLLNNFAFFLLLGFWLVLLFQKKLVMPHVKSLLLLTVPFIILLIGGINSSNLEQLATELSKSIPFFIFPIILFSSPFKISFHQFKMVLKAFVAGNIVICIFLIGVIFYKLIENGFSREALWSLTHQSLSAYVLINAIYLSLFIVISLIILVYFFLENADNWGLKQKLFLVGISSILILILIFLSSRTIVLSGAFIISIMFFQHFLKRGKALKSLFKFVLVGVVISAVAFSINPVLKWRLESIIGIQDSNYIEGKEEGVKMRSRLWSSSLEVFKDNWLFGTGSGDFKDELIKVYKKHKYRVQYRHEINSHNQYLSYMVSNGIIGLFLFLIYLFYPISMYFKGKNWLPFFISILFVLSFITESYLYTNKGVVVVSFFMTLMFYSHYAMTPTDQLRLKKKTILFAVQLPPPIHGSSIINDLIVNNEKMKSYFNTETLPIQMANSMKDLGHFSVHKLLRTFKIFLSQIYIFLTRKVDIYYVTLSPISFAFYKDFILILIAKMFQKNIIIHLHGQGIHNVVSKSKMKRGMYRCVFKNTQVICLAKPLYDDIRLVYDGTPIFLANGIKKESSIEYLPKTTTFLYLSNLMKAKGIEVFLNALVVLKNMGYDFSAEVVGNSADYSIEEAKEFINTHNLSDKVKVLGPIYGMNKYAHLTKAKVFVLPSFRECFPLTILEAFQAKTAVISTNTGGISEIVTYGKNGFVIDPNDLNALVERMEQFITHPNLHLEMGELNFAKFVENYTQEIFIEKLIGLFQSNLK